MADSGVKSKTVSGVDYNFDGCVPSFMPALQLTFRPRTEMPVITEY